MTPGSTARVLIVGAGGLGAPAARVLARSGVQTFTVLDDDRVEASNLHRQTLFGEDDVGEPKAPLAAERLERIGRDAGHGTSVRAQEGRLTPDVASELVQAHDAVVEGADNFATKFLTVDACRLAGVPAVQAGAVRWSGWALASVRAHGACLRCVFEDIPRDRVETCAEAGVVGPVVGVVGAAQASLTLRVLRGDSSAAGELWSYRAHGGTLRRGRVSRRADCPLCTGEIRELTWDRYTASCAA